ncbi:copper resistance protein B [Novosphingobium sp. HR1a]|uniref:copper resistance protein B n=1 Tax=Novosphingobium sp. HR1a TaxID=1395637 RepID=UPI001B3C7990|nr:copper resistance protein B [Novosphingobium sp. HR1a]MBF7015730.1 copper resistance protein B [Novosphingobium sp. HR1a]MCC4254655.1 copper resistance protein B [Sphingobium naphthae]
MKRSLTALFAGSAMLLAMPTIAQGQSMQGMDHSSMPGMTMPAKKPAPVKRAKKPASRKPAQRGAAPRRAAPAKPAANHSMEGMDHSAMPGMAMPQAGPVNDKAMPAMDHSAMPGMNMSNSGSTPKADDMQGMNMSSEHAGHDMEAMQAMEMTGTALPAGNAPAPTPPMDHYAERQFPAADMAQSRMAMMREQGGQSFSQVMFNLAEYRVVEGRDGYRWDGEAWFGGDINRLTLKSEGEGAFGERLESAEIQALYSRAIGPYFNLQAGIRQDFKPSPSRTYATIGFEGLAPYWFEVEGALFLSNKGDLLGRLEGYYDQRITQRLVLQPRAELNFSAQDVPENHIGAGLSSAELGLRLRYEITRQFAPYVGVSYDAKTGQTARYARADGEDPTSTNFVAGVRIWF